LGEASPHLGGTSPNLGEVLPHLGEASPHLGGALPLLGRPFGTYPIRDRILRLRAPVGTVRKNYSADGNAWDYLPLEVSSQKLQGSFQRRMYASVTV
jgi:hypothetical protein